MSEKVCEPNPQMDAVLTQLDQLHSSPAAACQVLQLLKDVNFDVHEVEKLLETDPALAASILKLVNSSMFSLSRKVGGIRQAVAFLGIRSLRLAVLSFGLVDRLTQGISGQVCSAYWRRALTMAVVSSRLAAGQNNVATDEAYSAGLLADVGLLALAQVDTETYTTLYGKADHGTDLSEQEHQHYGFDHAALGAQLLDRWCLPEPITVAIGRHHDASAGLTALDRIVATADILADIFWTPGALRLPEARRMMSAEFGADLDGLITLASICKEEINENAQMFRVELEGSINCQDIRDHATHQFKIAAVETAADWDSMQAVTEMDYSP